MITSIPEYTSLRVNEKTFRAGESVTMAEIFKTEMQYTFTDGTMIVFMNMETFEEVRIDRSKFENNQIQLLKEGTLDDDACMIDCILPHVLNYHSFDISCCVVKI